MENKTKPLNNQDVFNRVWNHFIVQRNRMSAIRENGILFGRYRSEEGKCSCAIGCMIPDELYTVSLENNDISSIISVKNSFYNPKIADWFMNVSSDFLNKIQRAHDDADCSLNIFENKLKKLAVSFGLTFP